MTSKAAENLSSKENGFFLMIEGSQIDWGGHANNTPYVLREVKDFDDAIGVVLFRSSKSGYTSYSYR